MLDFVNQRFTMVIIPRTFLTQLITKTAGGILPVVLPPLHIFILYSFWGDFGRRVSRQYCSCSCWDTIFKGTYESGIASYKHLYFNATANTMKMWVVTVLSVLFLYECCKHLLVLVLEGRARYLMCLLFASSLFAHYYTWWVYVNYWNDDYYSQWNHQLFFTVTEVLSTAFVVHLSNTRNVITSQKVVTIVAIATVHILAGGLDQFLSNVIFAEGQAHQVVRDLAFMIPDLLHVLFPLLELRRSSVPALRQHDILLYIFLVTAGSGLSYLI